jgi:FAD:protein FMN transferase
MRFILLILTVLSLVSCSRPEPLYNTQSYVFGTIVDISIYGESDEEAQAISSDINRQLQDLHNRLHAWRPGETVNLNHAFAKGQTPITVKPDLIDIIEDAAKLSAQTRGAFNPAIGNLVDVWGFHHDEFKAVTIDENKIRDLVAANPQMSDIVIENNKVFSNNVAVKLDFGGYAKGYALDLAMKDLQQKGVKNALINIGGNVIALGKRGSKPWRVGIQHPRKPSGTAIATLDLPSGWAIGTSGDYQRYFELKGKRFCHIIDPATGYPVENIQSVTVLIPPQANAGVLSDVASKPIFIAKREQRQAAASEMKIDNYLVIESEKAIFVSPKMAGKLTWLDKDAEQLAVKK